MYSWVELVFDLLKAFAWPVFLAVILLAFKKELIAAAVFLGNRVHEKRLRTPDGRISPRTDAADSQQEDVSPVAMKATARDYATPEMSKSVANPIFTFGFYKLKANDTPRTTKELDVIYEPEYKHTMDSSYPIGQKVEFAIINFSRNTIHFPLCAVQFPASFKHLDTKHPEKKIRTINSNLWGMGGRLTELREISSDTIEMSSVPKRSLSPGEVIRFFLRFNLPNENREFRLKMTCSAQGVPEQSSDLMLRVMEVYNSFSISEIRGLK